MLMHDDALSLPQCQSSKGPTAEEINAPHTQQAWLEKHIDWQALRRLIHKNMRDPVAGSEIVQTLYRDMLQWTPEELQGLRSPQGYANSTVIHRLGSWRRKRPEVQLRTGACENVVGDAPLQEEFPESREQVIGLLAQLPKEWSESWVLARYYGYTHAQIAQKSQITVEAAKTLVYTADAHLQLLATAKSSRSPLDRIRNFFQRRERRHGK